MYGEEGMDGEVIFRHHHETQSQLTPELALKLINAPAGGLLTHGATPLDRIATIDQQVAVRDDRQELADNPPEKLDIPKSIVKNVSATFRTRFEHRAMANEENFNTCLQIDSLDELDPETTIMLERARFGSASPAELLYLRNVLGIRSIELACLTHPYGQGVEEYLEPMRDAVKYGIETLGGQYFPEAAPKFAIKEAIIEEGRLVGLLITRKRFIGMMPDDTAIRERSSFILRMDSTFIDDRMRATLLKYDYSDPSWEKQLIDETDLEDIIKKLLKDDKFGDAIPISTTIYAYNQRTAEKVYELNDIKREERRKRFQESLPTLFETLKDLEPLERTPETRKTFNTVQGMYVNTSDTTED